MSRRHRIVLMPIFLRNLIQHWHCQHFRIHHYPVKNMLQPVLVGNNMCFKENDHRCSCHLDSFHFCTHQTLSLIKSKNPHFGRQSFQLRFFGVLVPIGYPNVLVHQLIWCKMQNCLHGAFHMHPLLSKPRDNNGNCMVREVFPAKAQLVHTQSVCAHVFLQKCVFCRCHSLVFGCQVHY